MSAARLVPAWPRPDRPRPATPRRASSPNSRRRRSAPKDRSATSRGSPTGCRSPRLRSSIGPAGSARRAVDGTAHRFRSRGRQKTLLAGKPGGLQAGAMLAFLSSAILGQYDPFTGEHGALLLVAPTCCRWSARCGSAQRLPAVGVPARGHAPGPVLVAPWMGDYMRRSVATLGEAADEPMTEMVTRSRVRCANAAATTCPRISAASSDCCARHRPSRSGRRWTGC